MNLIDMDRLRKELMAKGDIPIHEVFNTIWDQPIVNICEVKEQQPCEDCISRNDAIELIAGTDETNGNEPVFSGKQVIKMLKGLPSVTQKTESENKE